MKFTFTLCSLMLFFALQGGHLELLDHHPGIVSQHRLIDIGETDMDSLQLSRLFGRLTLGCDLNGKSFGVANTRAGGFVFGLAGWKYAPQLAGMEVNFHAINQRGDLLISLVRSRESVEWMVWPWHDGAYGALRKHIHTADPFASDFFLTGFNAQSTAIGYQKKGMQSIPIIWSADGGLQKLGAKQGIELYGIAKAINDAGSIVGVADELADRYPFFWKACDQLDILKNYRQFFYPRGWQEFADMVLTQDDVIYGTFWIRHLPGKKHMPIYYAYRWRPKSGQVDMLDLQGMRLAGVNAAHTLVGSLNGKAVQCELGKKPLELIALLDPSFQKDWELLEGSAINDKGQIAGYGTYRGKMHIFIIEPIP